jgi:hypothetical protein
VTEPLIVRRELEALLFNVADMAYILRRFDGLVFREDEDDAEEDDEG